MKHSTLVKFKTNPAYRGRKLENILLLFVNMVQFKTNPAYRGRKLDCVFFHLGHIKFKTNPAYRGQNLL